MTLLILIWVSELVSILIHEIGHAVAIKIVGYELKSFKVGPIRYEKKQGKWRLYFDKHVFLGWVTYDAEESKSTLKSDMLVTLGGIIANILVGLLLVGLYYVSQGFYKNGLLIFVGLMSIFLGVINILPINTGVKGIESDGVLFWRLIKKLKPNK